MRIHIILFMFDLPILHSMRLFMIAKCIHIFLCEFLFLISSQLLHVSLNPDGRTVDWAENFTNTRFEEALNGAMFVSYKRTKNNYISIEKLCTLALKSLGLGFF